MTNAPQFRNDLGEVIRAFFDIAEIAWIEERPALKQGDVFVQCSLAEDGSHASVEMGGGGMWRYDDAQLAADLAAARDELERKKYRKRSLKYALYRALCACCGHRLPWGALTGIRPTKLVRELIREHGAQRAEELLSERFDVSGQKAELAFSIVRLQEEVLSTRGPGDFDLYVGIPFCATRCVYCSFAAYELGKGCAGAANVEQYVRSLEEDIARFVALVRGRGYTVRSVYVGGGTPTALSEGQLRRVLEGVLSACSGFGREFTVEAGRPDTIDEGKLRMMKELGVTRISINPQSMNPGTLELIGRSHTPGDIERAMEMARKAGFGCINMDTIIGLPGETPDMVAHTMEALKRLSPENLTVHTLAIKRSSRLKEKLGEYPLPTAEEAEQMLEISAQGAREMGMEPYYMYRQKYMRGNLENVGWCKKGYASIYNIDIMEETTSILALGAGAISKWVYGGNRIERAPNLKDLATYLAKRDEMLAKVAALL